jgi:peptidoglycan/LPS O-acetylase OafA/YrhL
METTIDQPRGSSFHIKGLDGIRAVSIALVFFSHLGFQHLSPGMFGVSVFFLLSGFLITTLMIREHAARGRVSIREFYVRRGLRIFPPMYLIIAVGVILVVSGILPAVINMKGVMAQCLHLTNYYSIKFGDLNLIPGLGVY